MDHHENIQPMGITATIIYWAIPAIILYTAHYILAPAFVARTGRPYLHAYIIAWVSTMMFFLIAAIAAYFLEGNPRQMASFAERYRLRPMSRGDWLWVMGIFGFLLITYFGLSFTARWLAEIPFFAPHQTFPPELGPDGASGRAPGTFLGSTITGQAWIAVLFLFGWLFNILGEELWFRGYILPRQEKAFGRRAWLANGLMFTMNHIWQPWNLLLVLPGALFAAFIVQKRANTWILIIPHGMANIILLIIITLNAFGVVV